MLQQVGQALLKRLQVLMVQIGLCHTAMILQRADGGDDHHGVGMESAGAALDVQEFLSAQVCGKAGLGHSVLAQLERRLRGLDGVTAVCNVCKRTSVDEGGSPLQSLNQVGLNGILQNGSHGAFRLQVMGSDRLIVAGIGHNHLG